MKVDLGTSKEQFSKLKCSIQVGKTFCSYLNLYKVDGTPYSCLISLTPITGSGYACPNEESTASRSDDPKCFSDRERQGVRHRLLRTRKPRESRDDSSSNNHVRIIPLKRKSTVAKATAATKAGDNE